jgi:hypothetical protein
MTKPRVYITGAEQNCIQAIANRALVFFPDRDERDILMDLTAAHLACPLRLQDLLDADDFNFVHDIAGIAHHLNRQTFRFEDCFAPRFADLSAPKPGKYPLRHPDVWPKL